jgi:fucose permease
MTLAQILFGVGLVLVLLFVAGFVAYRQVLLLRGLGLAGGAATDEVKHLRHRAWRRLVSCGLMAILAILLFVALVFLEVPAWKYAFERQEGEDSAARDFFRFYGWYWLGFLCILLLLLFLAGVDLWAVRRYGRRQMRRLQDEQRALLAEQAALLRRQRGNA